MKSVRPNPSHKSAKFNEKPITPEKNPPGDIPDTQVFVTYSSTGGYTLKVPEGWAQTSRGTDVKYTDKFNGVSVTITNASALPSSGSVRKDQIPAMKKTERSVLVRAVEDVKLAGGSAVLVVYDSNSDPDPVTDKKIRLESNRYFFYKNGKLAKLTLWAPLGADNIDQWKLMANSFRWK